jgi:hypothetical protein
VLLEQLITKQGQEKESPAEEKEKKKRSLFGNGLD